MHDSVKRRLSTAAVMALSMLAAVSLTACNATPAAPPFAVAILVLDDFDDFNPDAPTDDEKRGKDSEKNCTFPAQEVGGKGAPDMHLGNEVSHGAAVYDQIATLFDTERQLSPDLTVAAAQYGLDGYDYIKGLRRWTSHSPGIGLKGQREILLVGVDTDEFGTDKVIGNMKEVIGRLKSKGINHIVANLSFQIAPCNPKEWLPSAHNADVHFMLAFYRAIFALYKKVLATSDQARLGAYLDGLVPTSTDQLMGDANLKAITDWFTEPNGQHTLTPRMWVPLFYAILAAENWKSTRGGAFSTLIGDPLDGQLATNFGIAGIKVIPVAAAGNGLPYDPPGAQTNAVFTFPFPFAPGMWNSVVSAAAESASGADRIAGYSNGGEVLRNGILDLQGPALTPSPWKVSEKDRARLNGNIHGTSFAAPRLSFLQALYLVNGGPVQCANSVPPLGYTNVNLETSPFAWKNLTLAGAAAQHCPDFLEMAQLKGKTG